MSCGFNLCCTYIQKYTCLYLDVHMFRFICFVFVIQLLSHIQLFCDPMDCKPSASRSMGLPRQKYWSGLPFHSPRDFPKPRIELASPALAGRFFTLREYSELTSQFCSLPVLKKNACLMPYALAQETSNVVLGGTSNVPHVQL